MPNEFYEMPRATMNAKTWQTVCGSSLGLFFVVAATFIFPPSHPVLRHLGTACFIILALLCLVGAWFGILLCVGGLHFGCPFCRARSQVTGGTSRDLYIECPSCGPVCVSSRPFRIATASKLDTETQ